MIPMLKLTIIHVLINITPENALNCCYIGSNIYFYIEKSESEMKILVAS